MRYVAGTPQETIDNQGYQFYHGINDYQPHADGRTPQSALRKFSRAYPNQRGPFRIWDREEARFVEVENHAANT